MRAFCALLLALTLSSLWGCAYRRAVMAEDHLAAGADAVHQRAWEAATREFAAAAAKRPRSGPLHARVGLIYEQAGHCRDAVPWLREALDLQPRQPWPVPVALMTCLEHTGRSEEAEEVLRAALTIYHDDPMALNNIGYTAADRGLHLGAAARLLRRAVELAPETGIIIDSLGWCYYQQGRLDDALPLMTRAAQLAPSAEVLYHLGMVFAARGDTQAAAEQFTTVLGMDPTFTRAYEALTALTPSASKEPASIAPAIPGPIMEQ